MNAKMRDLIERMTNEPQKITSYDTCAVFMFWVIDNKPEYIQGWKCDYSRPNPYFGNHYMDEDFVWSERKVINDWIDRVQKEYRQWLFDLISETK